MLVNCFILQLQEISTSSFVHLLHLFVLQGSNSLNLWSSVKSRISWHGIRHFLKSGRLGVSYLFWVYFHGRLWLILLLHLRLHLLRILHVLWWILLKLSCWILVSLALILLLQRFRRPKVLILGHFVSILILLCGRLHCRLIVLTSINLLLLPAWRKLLF